MLFRSLGLSHGTRQAGDFERKPSSLAPGTDGSNPSPSSEESAANSIQIPGMKAPGQAEDANGQQHPAALVEES